jgi:hypothetical protein
MTLPLPTLSWTQRNFVFTGSLTPTEQQVLDALNTAITASTHWEVKSSGAGYLEIGTKAGSAIPNFKAIFCQDPGAGCYQSPDTQSACLFVGIAPNGGTLGSWNSATPYGANRFSKYWKCLATQVCETLYIVESAEILAVFFKDDSLANRYYGIILGALWEATDQISCEADDRIYGMITSGSNFINVDMMSTATGFIDHYDGNGGVHVGFFKPTQPTVWEKALRMQMTVTIDTNYNAVSLGGTLMTLQLYHCSQGVSKYYVGKLRQIRIAGAFGNRLTIVDGSLVKKGIIFAPTENPSSNDSIMFCEG